MNEFLNKLNFAGKRVLISGGLETLSFAVAKKFLEHNAQVIVVDQDAEKLTELKQKLASVTIVQIDTKSWDQVDQILGDIMPIHHLVYDMPTFGKLKSFMEYTEEDLEGVYDANITPIVPLVQSFARAVFKHSIKNGTIVCISSISAAHPHHGTMLWGSSKGAIEIIAKMMAKDFAPHGIRVNSVRPATCHVPKFTNLPTQKKIELEKILSRHVGHRLVDPDEVANAVLILSSTLLPSMTGSVLDIDAGYGVL